MTHGACGVQSRVGGEKHTSRWEEEEFSFERGAHGHVASLLTGVGTALIFLQKSETQGKRPPAVSQDVQGYLAHKKEPPP